MKIDIKLFSKLRVLDPFGPALAVPRRNAFILTNSLLKIVFI